MLKYLEPQNIKIESFIKVENIIYSDEYQVLKCSKKGCDNLCTS